MKLVSFYDPETGLFTGRQFCGSLRSLEANTPPGTKAIEGRYDQRRERVDIVTGEVVAYEPPPDPDAEQRERRRKARRRIGMLERRVIRPMRELLLDPTNAEARRRLEAIEVEIAELRADLRKPTA